MHAKLLQPCPTLCDFMDCSLTGSSVHRILQERILEWVAISYSRGSFWPRDQRSVSYLLISLLLSLHSCKITESKTKTPLWNQVIHRGPTSCSVPHSSQGAPNNLCEVFWPISRFLTVCPGSLKEITRKRLVITGNKQIVTTSL